MSSDSENFDQLRRLLVLKKHEQPPPGYFDHFSRNVIARIKAGDQGEPKVTGWLPRLWVALEAKPIFAGAFGAAVCVVLVSGILNSEGPGVGPVTDMGTTPGGIPITPVALNHSGETMTLASDTNNNSLERLFEFSPQLAPNVQPASGTLNLLEPK
jgi:hypothetical protein